MAINANGRPLSPTNHPIGQRPAPEERNNRRKKKSRLLILEGESKKSPLGHRTLRATGLEDWSYRAIRKHMVEEMSNNKWL